MNEILFRDKIVWVFKGLELSFLDLGKIAYNINFFVLKVCYRVY